MTSTRSAWLSRLTAHNCECSPIQYSAFTGSCRCRSPAPDWTALAGQAQAFEQLDTPHRWATGCTDLGRWTLSARTVLKEGGRINVGNNLPSSVRVVFAENQASRNLEYQLSLTERRPIDEFVRNQVSLLVLTRNNKTARSFRSFFNRRIPLWEGHTRSALERLVDAIGNGRGHCPALAAAVVIFMNEIGKGFSPTAFLIIRDTHPASG